MEKQQAKKPLVRFTEEELYAVISLEDVESMLAANKALTPYHFEVLKNEVAFREQRKQELAKGMYGKDGKLLQSKKTSSKRLELIGIFEEQERLVGLVAKAKKLYFEFKQLRAAGQTPPELGQIFKETLDALWNERRNNQRKAKEQALEQDIEANVDKYLAEFNAAHHAV